MRSPSMRRPSAPPSAPSTPGATAKLTSKTPAPTRLHPRRITPRRHAGASRSDLRFERNARFRAVGRLNDGAFESGHCRVRRRRSGKSLGRPSEPSCPPRIFDRSSSATTDASAPSRMICGLMKRISSVRPICCFRRDSVAEKWNLVEDRDAGMGDVLSFADQSGQQHRLSVRDRQLALHSTH